MPSKTIAPQGAAAIHILSVQGDGRNAPPERPPLEGCGDARFALRRVAMVGDAVERLERHAVDAVLLDLGRRDYGGLETIRRIRDAAPGVPIVVLSDLKEDRLAVEAIRGGAQEYLVRGECEGSALGRAVLCAMERKRLELHVSRLAHYDGLTGVPNRRLLLDRLAQALAAARRDGETLSLLFLDLDNFKLINDSLGHSVGDLLLQSVARRLRESVRASDTVARLGGDEFAVVLPKIHGAADAARFARKVLELLVSPFVVEGHELFVSASIGISFYPADGETAEALLKAADMAMYSAKHAGRNRYQIHAAPAGPGAENRLSLANSLRRALDRGELVLHYQPQLEIRTGRLVGVEALLRWRHPVRGVLPPGAFIGLAEQTGLILPIGRWVLDQACERMRAWRDAGIAPARVAVNVSSRQITQEELPGMVRDALQRNGLNPDQLELELTESGLMHSQDAAVEPLREVRSLGVRVALDDFGTGYSSLSHLKRFRLDVLKIDQSFVKEIGAGRNEDAIGAAIITMAHALGLEVVAEGVETREQLAVLRSRRCDHAQGYYLSAPLPADVLERCLRGQVPWVDTVDTVDEEDRLRRSERSAARASLGAALGAG